jgi:hypothetical protein
MLHQYQQAYADFYATALGTSVSGLPVTASTTVSELENLIQGATNTSNISAVPMYGAYEEIEETPIDDIDDMDDNDLVTM